MTAPRATGPTTGRGWSSSRGEAQTAGRARVIISVAGDAPAGQDHVRAVGDNECPDNSTASPGSGRRMTPCSSARCPQMTVRRRTTSPIPRPDGSSLRSGPGPANRTGSDPHPEPTRDAGRHRWPASAFAPEGVRRNKECPWASQCCSEIGAVAGARGTDAKAVGLPGGGDDRRVLRHAACHAVDVAAPG